DEGSSEPIAAQAGDESRRLPMTVGDGADEALAFLVGGTKRLFFEPQAEAIERAPQATEADRHPRSAASQSRNSASVASGSAPRPISNACSWPASLRGGRPHGKEAL